MAKINQTCLQFRDMLLNLLDLLLFWNSLVTSQKGESQNECFKKTKHVKFPEKQHFLLHDTHTTDCGVLDAYVFFRPW